MGELRELTDTDRAILELAIRDVTPGEMLNGIADLGMTETGYYARLSVLLDSEEALAAYPVGVARLRRLAAGRRRWMLGVGEEAMLR